MNDEGPSDAEGLLQRLSLPREIVARLLFTLHQSCYVKRGTDRRYTLANDFFHKWLSEKAGRPLREIVSSVSKEAIIGVSPQTPPNPISHPTKYEYDDFVLLMTASSGREGRYQVRVIDSHEGQASGWLSLNLQSGRMQDRLRRTKENWTGENRFRTFGEMLLRAVFRRTIGDLYRKSEGYAQGRGRGLRLRLMIEPPELLVLPWELLFDPLRDHFLARSPHRPLSHFLPRSAPPRTLVTRPPLRLLVVISNPENLHDFGLQKLDANQEKKHITVALHEWSEAGSLKVEIMDHAIVSEIRQKLRRFKPQIVHFIGHGGFLENRGEESGCLVLEDEERRCKLIDELGFSEMVDVETTRLVVLDACETAASSSIRALSGLAPRLVQVGMSAVVAMRYPIKDEAAITFSREFYRALAARFAVDAAVADARGGLFLEWGADHRSWFTPVVFMRAPDGRLFDLADLSLSAQ